MGEDLSGVLRDMLGEQYHLERELGGGGMSRVFLAREEPLSRAVVIKVLPPELACRTSIARFEREVALTVQLQHPHILPLLTAGGRGDVRYHVTPYLRGQTLREHLRTSGRLSPEETVRLLSELADAVAYAHSQGVVHRDIKPENIFLAGGHAVLADFGVARALTPDDDVSLTAPDTRPGTPAYMPPEPAPDGRGDVYALAVVGWEMVTGARPTRTLTFASDDEAVRDVAVLASVPTGLRAVLVRGMAPDPAQRYSTAAVFCDALRAAPLVDPPRPRARRRLTLGTAVVAAAAAVVAAVRGRHAPGPTAQWEDDLVAVAPFETIGPGSDIGYWKEGLMYVVSSNLDGAGPLHVVPTTTSLAAWRGRPDPVSARELSRRTRARFVVYGTLVAVDDSLRLRGVVYDAAVDRGITEVDLRDGRRDADRLADSLTVGTLQAIAQQRPVVAVRLRQPSLGTRSLAALKWFLQGEQHYRRNRFDSAQAYYEGAIRKDSAFALAYSRMRGVLRATRAEDDSLSLWYAERAARMNHGLSPRDSMMVLADSLYVAAQPLWGATPPWRALVGRRLAVLEQLTVAYPADPEAWHELGEARQHFGEAFGVASRETLGAFERAIALDSAYLPSYFHAVELSLGLLDTARARSLADAAVRFGSPDSGMAFVRQLLRAPAAASTRRAADSLSVTVLSRSAYVMRRWPDSTEWAARLYEHAHSRLHLPKTWYADSAELRRFAVTELLFRGHAARARATAGDALLDNSPAYYRQQLALLGAIPVQQADSMFRDWTAGTDGRKHALSLSWWARRANGAALDSVRRACERQSLATSEPDRTLGPYCVETARAYAALVAGDTLRALTLFDAVPDTACSWSCAFDRVEHARLLAAAGRYADAARVLDRRPSPPYALSPTEVLWTLARAAVAEQLGDRVRAREGYRFVVAAWRSADPVLQPRVDEARAGLQRVGDASTR